MEETEVGKTPPEVGKTPPEMGKTPPDVGRATALPQEEAVENLD